MADRATIERELEHKLAQGEAALNKMKASMAEAGHEASAETSKAVAAAERTLEKGQAKLVELKNASDEEFDELWGNAKEAWHELTADVERGWDRISDKVKSFFA
jgi:DNA polymerase III delta prime subunit